MGLEDQADPGVSGVVCICGLAGRNHNRNTDLSLLHDGCVKLLQWISS